MKQIQNKVSSHWQFVSIIFLLMVFVAVSCDQSDLNSVKPDENGGHTGNSETGKTLGLVAITISGIGSKQMKASAKAIPLNSGIKMVPTGTSGITEPANSDKSGNGTIELKSISNGSFTYGVRGSGGMRYLYATFKVRNATALIKDNNGNVTGGGDPYDTPRENLTFLAVDTKSNPNVAETYSHTAVSKLSLFDGSDPTDATALAKTIIPTGQVNMSTTGNIESTGPDVLQVFTENEVQNFEASLTGTDVNDIFPYGFVVRSFNVTPNSRTLPANPKENEFDGIVTFAFKIPLQAQANQDPFEITMMFLAVDDGQTRITRSIQEALYGGSAAFNQRATELNATMVTLLGNTAYSGSSLWRTLCNTLVAGTKLAPETTLTTAAGCNTNPVFRYYVDADANGTGDGSTWNNAFTDLQSALAIASNNNEIWVAEGTYYPDEGAGQTDGDRNSSFQLINGVKIYGGFDPGTGDDTFAERDWQGNVTTLSGDLDQNDGADFTNNANNAYNVVTGSGTGNTFVLAGFTITGGNADGLSYNPQSHGAGILINHGGSLILMNVTISGNRAGQFGGGIYNYYSSAVLTNVTISGNTTDAYGGGVGNMYASLVLTNVTISGNTAYSGGGIYSGGSSSADIYNSIIWGNTGGEITSYTTTLDIVNSTVGNGCPSGSTCTNDPLFTNAAIGDFTLQVGSPSIDAGDNSLLPSDTYDLDGDSNTSEPIPFDLAGNPRVVNNIVDMGAYENQN